MPITLTGRNLIHLRPDEHLLIDEDGDIIIAVEEDDDDSDFSCVVNLPGGDTVRFDRDDRSFSVGTSSRRLFDLMHDLMMFVLMPKSVQACGGVRRPSRRPR